MPQKSVEVGRWGEKFRQIDRFHAGFQKPRFARGGGREKEQVVKRDFSFLFLDTDLHVSGGGKSATIVGRKKKIFNVDFFLPQNPFNVSKEDARN